jgi:hypothetical protein
MLVEECGSGHRTFEVDVVTQFPTSLYRYQCHNWTGLIARVVPDKVQAQPGDDKRLDRQYLGRALLNDIGVSLTGPHGRIAHREQAVRLLNGLDRFGLFDDEKTEMIPYWRSGPLVRYGREPPAKTAGCYVSVYRRPLEGARGMKALLVIMNESPKPVARTLEIVDAERLLGGKVTLTASEVYGKTSVPKRLEDWWSRLCGRDPGGPVLMDLETGDIVAGRGGGSFGPVHVPYHDYRVLYAHSER